ncbi:hypothetical protein ACC685_38605, partial [Rhizobium ruizarguesonis]
MFRSSLFALLLASVSANAWAASPAVSAAIATCLVAHRAFYDLELKDASDRSGNSCNRNHRPCDHTWQRCQS